MTTDINIDSVVYLDNHATTPTDKRVVEAMIPYFTKHFGNASSSDHLHGIDAARAVQKAREIIAKAIGAESKEIVFTSGATESDNLAIFGLIPYEEVEGKHIITSEIEHKAILESCKYFEKLGGEVTYLKVNTDGIINYDNLESNIKDNTKLISLFAANNEVGSIHDLGRIGAIAKKYGVYFHTDAVQAFGRIKMNVRKDNISMMSLSAHKIYDPKGIGALFTSKRSPRVYLTPILRGGGQEGNVRSGTLNVPGIVGFGEAVRILIKESKEINEKSKNIQSILFDELSTKIPHIKLNGPRLNDRLSHNLNLYIQGIESKSIIQLLGKKFSISAGSACTTDIVKPSHVLMAMYNDENRAHQSIRIGIGKDTTIEQIKLFVTNLEKGVRLLQNMD